jgi:predicted Zn-dependent protease
MAIMMLVFVLSGGFVGGLTGCATSPATGETVPKFISDEQEIAIGEEAAPQFANEFGGEVDDPVLRRYVSRVGGQVAAVSDRDMPYEFYLVRSDVPNAFALPGGKIFITAGLMRRMTNQRQLAAVLGHEVGHVADMHNIQGMQRQMGQSALVKVAQVLGGEKYGSVAGQVTQVVTSMKLLEYSRDQEHTADRLGVRYMTRAGYNPRGMIELLSVLDRLSNEEKSKLGELFRTHPYSSDRIDNVREHIQANETYRRAFTNEPDPKADEFHRMRNRLKDIKPPVKPPDNAREA